MEIKPEHLGDGAYVSYDENSRCVLLTANHHDPAQASDVVGIDSRYGVDQLIQFISRVKALEREG